MPKIIPPGLLSIHDLLTRFPEERKALLTNEIRRREEERTLFFGTKRLMSFHVWQALKTVLVIGLPVFLLVGTVGELARLAQWIQQAQQYSLAIPLPWESGARWDVGKMIPTSTALTYASQLPLWNLRHASAWALVVMAGVFVERIVLGYLTWRQTRLLQDAGKEREEEIQILEKWISE